MIRPSRSRTSGGSEGPGRRRRAVDVDVVYVHCQAGMNRSGLVTARVLMEQGMSADEAIDTVPDRRRGSLSDEYADWLRREE